MTQYKLAQETGLYHSTMTDILNCKYQIPNFKNMLLIIRDLGMSMTEFLIVIFLILKIRNRRQITLIIN